MKIEIDADDLFYLKEKLKDKEVEIRELQDRLQKLNENEIMRKTKLQAWNYFEGYMALVFKELGFTENTRPITNECDFWRHVNTNDFGKMDDVKVDIGVDILGEFRRAYLMLGVKTK